MQESQHDEQEGRKFIAEMKYSISNNVIFETILSKRVISKEKKIVHPASAGTDGRITSYTNKLQQQNQCLQF